MSKHDEPNLAEKSIIDKATAADLPDHNPNVACAAGDYNHENHIGDDVDDEDTAAVDAAGRQLDEQAR